MTFNNSDLVVQKSPNHRHACVGLMVLVIHLLGFAQARAILLDWDTLDWTASAYSMTFFATNTANASTAGSRGIFYADDEYSGSGAITIAITGNTNAFTGATVFSPSPNDFAGGNLDGGTGERTLVMDLNFASRNSNVIITVTFSNYTGGVTGVFFKIFDIDVPSNLTKYVDRVTNLYARSNTGPAIAPTGVTGSPDAVVSGSGTNFLITGTNAQASNTSSNGTAHVDFGTNYITTFTFTYANSPDSASNPAEQAIALYDISFKPKPKVPEVGTSLAAATCCFLAMWLKRRRFVRPLEALSP